MSKTDWDIGKLSEFCLDAGLKIGIPSNKRKGAVVLGIVLGNDKFLDRVNTIIPLDTYSHDQLEKIKE